MSFFVCNLLMGNLNISVYILNDNSFGHNFSSIDKYLPKMQSRDHVCGFVAMLINEIHDPYCSSGTCLSGGHHLLVFISILVPYL